jgi:hypothetical protein
MLKETLFLFTLNFYGLNSICINSVISIPTTVKPSCEFLNGPCPGEFTTDCRCILSEEEDNFPPVTTLRPYSSCEKLYGPCNGIYQDGCKCLSFTRHPVIRPQPQLKCADGEFFDGLKCVVSDCKNVFGECIGVYKDDCQCVPFPSTTVEPQFNCPHGTFFDGYQCVYGDTCETLFGICNGQYTRNCLCFPKKYFARY